MPKAELVLWGFLRRRQICGVKFRRQFGIDMYVVDFYAPEIKLVIEADGDTHFELRDIEKDKRRQKYLEDYGIAFLRFTNDEIFDAPEYVIDLIRKKVETILNLVTPSSSPS
jgi:very-short-patch-repair endonuclease